MATTYETKNEVVAYEIEPLLGEYFDDFKAVDVLDDIVAEAFELTCDRDETGLQHGNCFFVQREDVDLYDVIAKYDPSNN